MATFQSESSPHILLFPFMSKGHTIPILHLARLLIHRNAAVTIFTTPANRPFVCHSLSDTTATVVDLPFPENIPGVLPGVESTDKLPSISLFYPFARATKLMKPHFEEAVRKLPRVTFMITDGFLGWTVESAAEFGIPRLVYYGMNNFSGAICHDVMTHRDLIEPGSGDELFPVPGFPWIKVAGNDFEPALSASPPAGDGYGLQWEFTIEVVEATSKSYGVVVNSFYELEPAYLNYWNSNIRPKAWCVGPLCLAERPRVKPENHRKPSWIQWLDEKLEEGKPVLYVAFGSQAEISPEQFREIKTGLEKSESNFLWVVRGGLSELIDDDGFEERVRERGLVVREWVDQREILGHGSVKGFLSHCGWNSALESICAAVPILAWPMMAEQPLNARMVVDEIKVGLRVEACDGSVRGFVKWESLEKMVRELMEGEMGKEVRKKVKEVGAAAVAAVREGGSSWKTLNELINELS